MEKNLTPEELQEIKSLQNQIQEVTLQLGSLAIKKIQLKNTVLKLQEVEEQIANSLSTKYGKGTLDINTGKITLLEE